MEQSGRRKFPALCNMTVAAAGVTLLIVNFMNTNAAMVAIQSAVEQESILSLHLREQFGKLDDAFKKMGSQLDLHEKNLATLADKQEAHETLLTATRDQMAKISGDIVTVNSDGALLVKRLDSLSAELSSTEESLERGMAEEKVARETLATLEEKHSEAIQEATLDAQQDVLALQRRTDDAIVALSAEQRLTSSDRHTVKQLQSQVQSFETQLKKLSPALGVAFSQIGSVEEALLKPFKQTSNEAAQFRHHVAWFKECGCTGIEVEATTFLVALAERIGTSRVRTNACRDTCTWPASVRSVLDDIEVPEASLFHEPVEPAAWLVVVIHAAFLGVCGVPEKLHQGPRTVVVSRSMFEMDTLQHGASESCEQFSSVWVPSHFNLATFNKAGVPSHLMRVLPEAVDTQLFTCERPTEGAEGSRWVPSGNPILDRFILAGQQENVFTFISVFKWETRKDWRTLLRAFASAFAQPVRVVRDDGNTVDVTVRLLIKTQRLSWGTDPRTDSEAFARTFGDRFLLITDRLPTELMPRLYHAVDGFAMPTHGEGWGLPIVEAMASGLPTISTGWGGQTEFMNEGNSFMLKYTMDYADYHRQNRWAQASQQDLQKVMLEVVGGGHAVREKVERACREIHERFAPSVLAARIDDLAAGLRSALVPGGALVTPEVHAPSSSTRATTSRERTFDAMVTSPAQEASSLKPVSPLLVVSSTQHAEEGLAALPPRLPTAGSIVPLTPGSSASEEAHVPGEGTTNPPPQSKMPPPPDVPERYRSSLGGEELGTSNKGGAPVDESPHHGEPPVHAHPRDEKFAAEGRTTATKRTPSSVPVTSPSVSAPALVSSPPPVPSPSLSQGASRSTSVSSAVTTLPPIASRGVPSADHSEQAPGVPESDLKASDAEAVGEEQLEHEVNGQPAAHGVDKEALNDDQLEDRNHEQGYSNDDGKGEIDFDARPRDSHEADARHEAEAAAFPFASNRGNHNDFTI